MDQAQVSRQPYGVAAISVAAAVVLRLALDPILHNELPFLTFAGAMAFSAWYGGLKPGLAATALSVIAEWYFILEPRFSFHSGNGRQGYQLGLMTVAGTCLVLLIAKLQRRTLELRDSDESYRDLYENAPDMLLSVDAATGLIVACNATTARKTGYSKSEILGRPVLEMYHTSCENKAREALQEFRRYGDLNSVELVVRCKDGGALDVALESSAVRDESGRILRSRCVWREITRRKRAEAEYHGLFEGAIEGIYRVSPEGNTLAANPALARMLRYDSSEEVVATIRDSATQVWLHPRERARLVQLIEENGIVRGYEGQFRCKDGTAIWVSVNSRKVCGADGKTIHYEGFIEDITERKRTDEALREAADQVRIRERQLSTIYSGVSDALFLLSVEPETCYRFVTVNDAFLFMTGLVPGQVVGQLVHQIIPEPSLSLVLGKYEVAIREKTTVRWEETTTFPTGTQCGEVTVTPMFNETGACTHLVGMVRNLNDRKRAEEEKAHLEKQLQQSQKLETVGVLAGGVAHDFNNLMTVIEVHCSYLLEELDPKGELWASADQIRKAETRAANLTKQLLAFSRKEIIEPRLLDLNSLIGDARRMLRPLIGEDVELLTDLESGLGHVIADPNQIQQVLVNLMMNARDAMPGGGRVVIRTENIDMDGTGRDAPAGTPPGRYVRMTVTDNGTGMSEETRQRAFEPFFTTKGVGKGTGLGLSTVYGIIRQTGGWVEIWSALEQGSAFKVYLPRTDASPLPSKKELSAAQAPGGWETVLLVEDEEAVRSAMKSVLSAHGYRAIEAANAAEAEAAAGEFPGDIHLLLTDVVMPGINGKELSERLRQLRPGLKTIFMSGYSENVIAERGLLGQGVSYIPKPFSPNGLARKLREVLGGADLRE